MAEISLPVSLGEALDKLTILDIKCSKISDVGKKAAAQKEYDVLYASLKDYVTRYGWHYRILREINLSIWDQQDKFHGQTEATKPTEVELGKICSIILDENDRRFRVKAKINHIASSSLREVKGYAKKKAFLFAHLGLGDAFWMNGAVRYLSTCYDEVVVASKSKYLKNVAAIYADDPTIKILPIADDEHGESELFTSYMQGFWDEQGFKTFICGNYLASSYPTLPTEAWIYDFPYCFYDDLKMPRSYRKDYFYMPTHPEAVKLLADVKDKSSRWIIVHQQSQKLTLPIWEKLALIEKDPILDLNVNHYPVGHPHWPIAELVVNKPLYAYTLLLEQAAEIHLLESSVYCLASHLDLSRVAVKKCYASCGGSDVRIGVFEPATF
jgi:hypothetical protein